MNGIDLVDQMNFESAKLSMMAALDAAGNEAALAVCRDITVDQIIIMMEKFPLHTQKEILVILADKLLAKWDKCT